MLKNIQTPRCLLLKHSIVANYDHNIATADACTYRVAVAHRLQTKVVEESCEFCWTQACTAKNLTYLTALDNGLIAACYALVKVLWLNNLQFRIERCARTVHPRTGEFG